MPGWQETKISTHYFECQCGSDEHTLKFTLCTEYDEPPEIYTSVFLNEWEPWYKRAWNVVRYICGYKCKYGHFDCWLMRPEDVERLKELISDFENDMKNYEQKRK